jgi:hypothetical protein
MPPPFHPYIFASEIVFTVLAFLFCILIYNKTRESYELTRHKGIRYFRMAFLFFGFSYVLSFLFGLIKFSQMTFQFFMPRELFAFIFILPLGYLSTMGLFYLIYSIIWKRFSGRTMLIVSHALAVLLSIVSFLTRSHEMLLFLQCGLLILAAALSFTLPGKHFSKARVLYLLVAILWLINLLVLGRPQPFSLPIELVSQVVSLCVFIMIYYRVTKWLR